LKIRYFLSFVLSFTLTGVLSGDLPPEAIAFLATFPEKALTVDLVVGQAVKSSDSYRGLRAMQDAADGPRLSSKAGLDTRLTAQLGWQDDRSRPQTLFQPNRTSGTNYSLGLNTAFSTGTDLSFELAYGYRNIQFNPVAGFAIDPFYETRGTIGITQHLWKNFFGSSTRALVGAGEQSTDAQRAAYEQSRESWFLNITGIYYQAWLAQSQVMEAKKNLARQERLLRVVALKKQRGTAEEPDLLQVKSAKTRAEIQLQDDHSALWTLWRNLVTVLKLPTEWSEIDPVDIPMRLDSPLAGALQACKERPEISETNNAVLAQARASARAASYSVASARDALSPSLDLSLGFAANGVDGNSSTTITDFTRFTYPRYSAALLFTLPFGFYVERAKLAEAVANEIRAEAAALQALDSAKMDWVNGCLDLNRLQRSNEWLRTTSADQRRRENLEEERFQVGRSSTLQVIQAGGDATQAAVALAANEIALRASAWNVLKLNGKIRDYLNQLEQIAKK
jgi:outer membrane protein TolC